MKCFLRGISGFCLCLLCLQFTSSLVMLVILTYQQEIQESGAQRFGQTLTKQRMHSGATNQVSYTECMRCLV